MNIIHVTGDFLIDHHIYQGKRHHFGDHQSAGVCVRDELGGSALIHYLLKAMQGLPEFQPTDKEGTRWQTSMAVDDVAALDARRRCDPADPNCIDEPFSAYAFWRPYPLSKKTKDAKENRWRVSEAMGFGGGGSAAGEWPWPDAAPPRGAPHVLVISDGGMGFRSRMYMARWGLPIHDDPLIKLCKPQKGQPAKMPNVEEPGWIVLKMSAPVGEGDLWRELSTSHATNLVIVVAASELRRANVRLEMGMSWEQTLEDLFEALKVSARLQSLTTCRFLIISFDNEGAICLHKEGGKPQAIFVFDREKIEGERRQDFEGDTYGSLSCLTATVAAEIGRSPDEPDMENAMRRGLAAMRSLREHGHGNASKPGSGFPVAAIANAAQAGDAADRLQVRTFDLDPATCPVRAGWSLLALQESPVAGLPTLPLHGIGRRVLLYGPRSLSAPTLSIGNYMAVDRGEIEALRGLRQLVRDYLASKKTEPLSIGVFGPPGAGKSFAVKELAKALDLSWLEFNLSQFNDAEDLIGALHQVRDKVLEGKTPVAFFDEFDSQNYKWLKYLLAPMQDGKFQEGQISHPIGQSVFIFAGGTSATFADFEAVGEHPLQEKAEQFRLAKGPDFASRLDGKLNVVGPNPRIAAGMPEDIFYPVRRALFIRSRLRCGTTDHLAIHPGLATALLRLSRYKHGSRSLTKVLEPLRIAREKNPSAAVSLASLPPKETLALHLDLTEFDKLLREFETIAKLLGMKELAAAFHRRWCGPEAQKKSVKNFVKEDFDPLSSFDKASNFAAARRILPILALADLRLVSAEKSPASAAELEQVNALLKFHRELLAEAEHDGWMEWHYENGWSLDDSKDKAKQLHDQLKPYEKLTDKQKDNDRETIDHYPEFAQIAKLKIVYGTDEPEAAK